MNMQPIERVYVELEKKFPNIKPKVRKIIVYSLWFKEGSQAFFQRRLDDYFSEVPADSAAERDEKLYELLLLAGEVLCKDEELIKIIENALLRIRQKALAEYAASKQAATTTNKAAIKREEEDPSPAPEGKRLKPG